MGTVSQQFRDDGLRTVLYADLGNATSNALYRRLGYRPIQDGIVFRIGKAAAGR